MQGYAVQASGDGSTIMFFSTTPGIAPMWDDDSVRTLPDDNFIGVLYAYHVGSGTLVPLRGYGFFEYMSSVTSDGSEAVVTSSFDNVIPGHSAEFAYLMNVP